VKVVGLDLSLTSAGVARLNLTDDGQVHGTYTGHCGEVGQAGASLARRGARIQRQGMTVLGLVGDTLPDLAVVEAPSMGSVGGQPHDRSGLWWAVIGDLLAEGVAVAEVAPATLKVYACGTAGSSQKPIRKPHVVNAARLHWGRHFDITNDDIADAVVLAAMGARWLNAPIDDLDATHTRAMASAHWPSPT
jgi:crossover junction endodeoxyribonuclease RuvC